MDTQQGPSNFKEVILYDRVDHAEHSLSSMPDASLGLGGEMLDCGMAFPAGNIHVMMVRGFGIILAAALVVAIVWAVLLRI